jgi:hypothetical protein
MISLKIALWLISSAFYQPNQLDENKEGQMASSSKLL